MPYSSSMIVFISLLLVGCSSNLRRENEKLRDELASCRSEQRSVQQEALAVQRRNECLLRHNDAKHTCDLLFRGETNGVIFQNKMLQCMVVRGFKNGTNTCQ